MTGTHPTPLTPEELREHEFAREVRDAQSLVEFTGVTINEALRALRACGGDLEKAGNLLLLSAPDETSAESPSSEEEESTKSIRSYFAHLFPPTNTGPGDMPGMKGGSLIQLDSREENDSDPDGLESASVRATSRASSPGDYAARPTECETELDDMAESEREAGSPARSPVLQSIILALFHIPQVRQKLSELGISPEAPNSGSHEYATWKLVEMFACLDLARISFFVDSELLDAWNAVPCERNGPTIPALPRTRLFGSEWQRILITASGIPQTGPSLLGYIIPLPSSGVHDSGDLVKQLSATLHQFRGDKSSDHQVITEPSEIMVFQISAAIHHLPTTIYLDEFLVENLSLANETKRATKHVQKEIADIEREREKFMLFEGENPLEMLRQVISEYEHPNVLKPRSEADARRMEELALSLRQALQRLEVHVESLDEKSLALRKDLDAITNEEDLKMTPYDLRASLVTDGEHGPRHTYSYVRAESKWWKVLDGEVIEVPEDLVLLDSPYLVFYSQRQPDTASAPNTWPSFLVEEIERSSQMFLETLRKESSRHTIGAP
ncbi:unnamed protein product [Mycena citricolor]|uniref:USP domain-containing protein n=1 Tax=Mycena citricolor TaxID=2018698 RepID=A0AAD2K8A1_9AGAR|nr:unnamed protein product [Mycena citricolor]